MFVVTPTDNADNKCTLVDVDMEFDVSRDAIFSNKSTMEGKV